MKKWGILLLAAGLLTSALSGCKPEATASGAESSAPASSQTVSGDIYGKDENADYDVTGTITVGINSYRNSDFEALFKKFQELYSGVTVKPVLFEGSGDDATKHLTSLSMAGKVLPDILYDDAGSLPTYITNGWMYPLSGFLQGDSDFDYVPENVVNHFSYGGRLYALGQTVHSNALLINTDLVESMNVDLPEFGWNWSDFETFLKACTNSSYSGIEDLRSAYLWLAGAMSDKATVAGYQYDTKSFDVSGAMAKSVSFINSLANLRSVEAVSLKQNSSAGVSDYVRKFGNVDANATDAAFKSGKVASTFAGTWSYASWNQSGLPFDWEFYPVPQTTPGRIPIHIDYCWMTTSVTKENTAAAWQFLRFVTYSVEGNLARLTTYDDDHYTEDMNNAYYIPCTTQADVVSKFESLPEVTDAILYIFNNIGNGYLGDPEKTVPGFESVEYSIIGKPANEAINGQYDFTSKIAEAQTKANEQIRQYAQDFQTALSKFETEFDASH